MKNSKMQQIFNFIFKNNHRLLFFFLLGISLTLTIQSHSFHKSKIINSANFFTGTIYQRINYIEKYLNLETQNKILAQENARLKTILFNKKEQATKPKIDSVLGIKAKDIVITKVINNSYNKYENYLTINSGAKENIQSDMGVINDFGIVGIIDNVSANYATIRSILNIKSRINAKFKKSNHFGSLTWNGKSTGFVQLFDVPRSALPSIRKGDTIVTGAQSVIFPENVNIGTVYKIERDIKTNYLVINIRLFNDMTNIGYVYVLKNKNRKEIIELENLNK